MSEKFEREMGELIDAQNKRRQEAKEQQQQRETDTNQFISDWMQLRNSVVLPTLEGIAGTLTRMGVTSQVDGLGGAGLAIGMAFRDGRPGGVPGRLSFDPSPINKSVKVEDDTQPKDVKLTEITSDFIEGAVLDVAKRILRA
jgi:hypothetical protein